jgi:Ca2+-binding RTX toxin-like protein
MAIFTYGAALSGVDMSASAFPPFGNALSTDQTATAYRVFYDADLDSYDEFIGTGFTYAGGGTWTGGTITKWNSVVNGVAQIQASGLSMSVATYLGYIQANDWTGFHAAALAGNDTVNGSAGDDVLLGMAGKDALNGGGGGDHLDGGAGNDTMNGGAGDDTYVVDSTTDKIVEKMTFAAGGGIDTVESSVSYSLAAFANVDHLTLTGSDHINATGNALANTLTGNDGDNILDGGKGNDVLKGGLGDDIYIVDSLDDEVQEEVDEGSDEIRTSVPIVATVANVEHYTYTGKATWNFTGTAEDNILKGGAGIDKLNGADGNDQLFGNAGNDELNGGADDDLLDGGAGIDKLTGGAGNDTYVVDNTGDVITETGSDTDDVVKSSVSYTLALGVEQLILTGKAAINATGTADADALTGNDGANILDGLGGADTLRGGLGNDIYIVDDAGDDVSENADEGTDLVRSSVSYVLGAELENLELAGKGAINGTGNTLDNKLTGNDGDNRLDGGAGNDTLAGGKGNDTYVVSSGSDKIVEVAGAQGGIDTVESDVTVSLAPFANVENLQLTGSGNVNGAGNALANLLFGNSGDNTLDGGAGNDTLRGGGGTDVLKGGAGNDTYLLDSATITIDEGTSKDTGDTVQSGLFDINLGTVGAGKIENAELLGSVDLDATGNAAANTLIGNSGKNRLDGGAGNDTLMGGDGNDTYLLDSAKDVVKESANQGHDTVLTTFNTTTAFDNVEDYTFVGSGNWKFNGNGLDNVITGGAGDDWIDGGAGEDTVVFTGKSSDYQLIYTEGGAYVIDLNAGDGDDGSNWLVNVEQAEFSDITMDLAAQALLKGAAASENAGRSVAALGDINNDGYGDFIVGAPGSKAGGAGSGAAYVVFGDADGLPSALDLSTLNGTQGFKLVGKAGDQAGWAVDSAGDVNNDGFDDILVGALSADIHGKDSGGAYVVFGHGGGYAATVDLTKLNGTTGFKISGEAAGDFAGGAVHSAGDINGDGYDDLVIGADGRDANGNNSGGAYVVFGHGGSFAANLDLSSLNGANGFEIGGVLAFDHAGWSVSSAGDINGDGIDDLLVGAILAGTYGAYSGAAYVVFGHTGGFASTVNLSSLNGTSGFALNGVTQYDEAGLSVSRAGDINGDGFGDLIVGAPYSDAAGKSSGSAYVVFGHDGSFSSSLSLGSLNGANGFTIQGLQGIDYTGFSVSSAGDINGDGLDDIIIGAPNAGSEYYGAAYVLYGQADGFPATIDLYNLNTEQGFWVYGDLPSDAAGIAVSGAGDINGDGYDDLLVGAAFADPHGSASGTVRVIYGAGDGSLLLIGDENANTLIGTEEADKIRGRGGDDTLSGLGGDDLLDGGIGADTMIGDMGNDTYLLDDAGDKVVEDASGGHDTIKASGIDIDLTKGEFAGQEIEDVALLGSGNKSVTGNDIDNYLQGNEGDNRLSGGAGNDTLAGGLGNDTYIVDSTDDNVVEKNGTGSGIDIVVSAFSYTLGASVENLVLKGQFGTENLNGIGNELANTLTGNDGNNHLDGGLGSDILIGGKGLDTLRGGAQSDVYIFSKGDTGANAGERDIIVDFVAGVDRIDLSGYDANSAKYGDNLFRFIGQYELEEAGDLHFRHDSVLNATILEGDVDGDHVADFAIELAGKIQLTSQDFALGSIMPNVVRPGVVTIVNDDDVSIKWSGIRPTVSEAGDLNNDGYADFVFGLQSSSNQNGKFSGNAYVIYGTRYGIPEGLSLADLDGTNGFKVMGTTAGESLGYGADTAGDFNGDGVSDLLLSAPWYSGSAGSNPTRAYLLYGDPAGTVSPVDLSKLDPSDGIRLQGQTNFLGGVGSVASLGDVNADGYDDIIIGAPDENNRGNAYVVFGGSGAIPTDLTKLDGANGFSVIGQIAFGGLGQTVAGAGDLNGDGIKDIVIAESASSVFGDITPHVIFGNTGAFTSTVDPYSLDGTAGFSIIGTGHSQGYYFNQTIASAGDMNGDGYDDLIVGGNNSQAYVVFGHDGAFGATIDVSTLNGTNGFALTGKFEQYLGRSVTGVGDLNGDGYDDIVISAPGDPNSANIPGTVPGYAYVLYGHASGFAASISTDQITSDKGFVITGPAPNYLTGWSVSGAGDIDGDGLNDLLVASPGTSSDGAGYGEVQVIFGKADSSAIVGDSFPGVSNGSSAAEIIITAQGNDNIYGGGGADSIHGGSGNDHIHVADHGFFRADGGSGSDVLNLDFAGSIDFGNIDGNAATSDRGRISGIETLDVTNGAGNAMTLHLADVLDMDVNNTDVGGVSTLDNVLKIDGEAGDTLALFNADNWGAADTSTLAGYAIYSSGNVKVAVDVDIVVSVA